MSENWIDLGHEQARIIRKGCSYVERKTVLSLEQLMDILSQGSHIVFPLVF